MSRASEELERYLEGDMTLEELADLWAERTWKAPADMPEKTIESIELHAEDKMLGGEGTWDEVETFWLTGQLTWEDYRFISIQADQRAREQAND